MMRIPPEIIKACQRLLQACSQVTDRFTQRELGWLDQTIQWFDNPEEELEFSFSLTTSNGGKSTYYNIEFDGKSLIVEATQTSFDLEVGSDHHTTYYFSQSENGFSEDGDLISWCSNAIDALRFINDPNLSLEFSINLK